MPNLDFVSILFYSMSRHIASELGFRFGIEILVVPQRIDTQVLHVLQYFVPNNIQIDKSSYNFTNLTIFDN